MKARTLLDRAVADLKASEAIDHWQRGRERMEAEDLLIHVHGGEWPGKAASVKPKVAARFEELVRRRVLGEPIPYIKGSTEFRGLDLKVVPGVFVPRDSSEFLAEQAVRRLRPRKRPVLIDLACGAGPVALAVANEVPKARVWGADLSEDAVALARKNAKRIGVNARFAAGDLFDPLPRKLLREVDVITVHPPYVAKHEVQDLPDEIKEWEPVHTLTDHSDDGLGLVRRTVEESPAWLRKNGWLLMETDPDRARDVKKVMRAGGFRDVVSTKGGELKVTRVIVGRPPR
ncbi:MAG: HemK/PrmC family methyltransferase [Actinomycetota bacterium]